MILYILLRIWGHTSGKTRVPSDPSIWKVMGTSDPYRRAAYFIRHRRTSGWFRMRDRIRGRSLGYAQGGLES